MAKKKKITKFVEQYPVIVQEEKEGGYWVNCPLLEGCYSEGETIEEALENIKEAIELCLDDMSQAKKKKELAGDVSLHLVRV